MSTVKAVNFQHPSATQSNLVLAADGTVSGGLPSANRNLLYNGAMQVAQRGTSAAGITTTGYYTADRWNLTNTTLGTWTQSIESDAPTGSGLRSSAKMLCTTADASPAAGDVLQFFQPFEGQDFQRIKKGTSAAEQLTLSFWVKSNVTGTYIAYLYDNDNTRAVSASYTISASATWEQKKITFPADTTGALDNDNGHSLGVYFALAMGSNRTSGTLQTTWGAYVAANNAVGQTNLAAATNNYWQVTGVQLEVGPVASAFEFKSYGQELRECQRYYQRIDNTNVYTRFGLGECSTTTKAEILIPLPCAMRAKPSAIDVTATAANYAIFSASVITALSVLPILKTESYPSAVAIDATVASGLTAGRAAQLIANNTTAAFLGFSAEL